NIDDLVTDDDFRILKGGVSAYNGGFWLHKMGTRQYLWDEFDPKTFPAYLKGKLNARGRQIVGSDQAWMSLRSPGEKLYTHADGVYRWSSALRRRLPKDCRVLFFPGPMKPWDVATKIHNRRLW